jgi:hypothetical protein
VGLGDFLQRSLDASMWGRIAWFRRVTFAHGIETARDALPALAQGREKEARHVSQQLPQSRILDAVEGPSRAGSKHQRCRRRPI